MRREIDAAAQRGLSVVELMVAMLLSLLLLAGVLTVVASSKVTYAENERVARLQETGRAAIELILRDIRGAGYGGCAQSVPFRNILNDSNNVLWNFAQPLQGFEAGDPPALVPGGTWSPALPAAIAPNAIRGNDVFVVRTSRVGQSAYRVATSLADPLAPVVVFDDGLPPLPNGQPVLLADCAAATVFAVTGTAAAAAVNGNPTSELLRDGAAGIGPGNSTQNLGTVFQLGGRATPIDTIVYFLAPAADGSGPALWRRTGALDPVELLPGVQGLQVLYGEDDNGDRLVDAYREADAVGNFRRVIAVSIAMLIRSARADAADVDNQTYDLLGVAYGPYADRFQRVQLTTSATLRNQTD